MEFQKRLTDIQQGKLANIYLVLGKEPYLQDLARQTFLQSVVAPEDQDLNVGRFNMEEVTLQEALADAESAPFFGDKRLVMVDKPYFLTGEKERAKLDHRLEQLQLYLEQPVDSTVLVLFAPYEKLDSRKKIVKQLKKVAVFLDATTLDEATIRQLVQQIIHSEHIQIDAEILRYFLEKTQYSLTTAMIELEKLLLAAMDTGEITQELIDELVVKSLEQNVFELGEAILNKQAQRALELYQDMLLQKEDPLRMNARLVGQIRLLLQVSYLLKEGYHEPEMQRTLNQHPYRIKLAIQQVRRFSLTTLEKAYRQLVDTEYALKTGVGIREMQFELFILQFCGA